MGSPISFKLYNQVKTKFSVQRGQIAFILLTSDDVNELVIQCFDTDNDEYYRLIYKHGDEPYAVIDYIDDTLIYFFQCEEFLQKEDLTLGKIIRFQREPFKKPEYNPENIKADMEKLVKLLLGDSEAA